MMLAQSEKESKQYMKELGLNDEDFEDDDPDMRNLYKDMKKHGNFDIFYLISFLKKKR